MNRITRKQINQAMVFFRDSLFQDRLRLGMNTYVKVEMSENIDADGYCSVEDDDARPREFLVTLNKELDELRLLHTLAHEMVHVWQFATGRLRHYANGTYRYKNRRYASDTQYVKRPWELEAYKLEKELVNEWLEGRSQKSLPRRNAA